MFDIDFHRLGLPTIVEAHGQRWIAVYYVTSNRESIAYLAVPAAADKDESMPLPQVCSLISVLREKKDVPA